MIKHKQIDYYEQALVVSLASNGEDSLDAATLRNNLALTWDSLGEYGKAIDLYELALDTFEKRLGMTHQTTIVVGGNLARTRIDYKHDNKRTAHPTEPLTARPLYIV